MKSPQPFKMPIALDLILMRFLCLDCDRSEIASNMIPLTDMNFMLIKLNVKN